MHLPTKIHSPDLKVRLLPRLGNYGTLDACLAPFYKIKQFQLSQVTCSWVAISMQPAWSQRVKEWIGKFDNLADVFDTNGKKIEVVDGDIMGTLPPSAFPLTVKRLLPNPPTAVEKDKQKLSNPVATGPPTSPTLPGPCFSTPSPRGQVFIIINGGFHDISYKVLIYVYFPWPQVCSHLWRLPRSFPLRLEITIHSMYKR